MLFSETIQLHSCKQQVLLQQQQIFRKSNLIGSKQQLVMIFSYKQLELVNCKLKIPSSSTLILIEQYIFVLSHIKIYSAAPARAGGKYRLLPENHTCWGILSSSSAGQDAMLGQLSVVFGLWGWACEKAKRALPKKEKS